MQVRAASTGCLERKLKQATPKRFLCVLEEYFFSDRWVNSRSGSICRRWLLPLCLQQSRSPPRDRGVV